MFFVRDNLGCWWTQQPVVVRRSPHKKDETILSEAEDLWDNGVTPLFFSDTYSTSGAVLFRDAVIITVLCTFLWNEMDPCEWCFRVQELHGLLLFLISESAYRFLYQYLPPSRAKYLFTHMRCQLLYCGVHRDSKITLWKTGILIVSFANS